MENLFRKEVLENKRHRLEGAVSLVQPPVFKTLTFLILFVVIISLIYLTLGSYARKERVTGVLEPNTGVLSMVASQEGVIAEVLVEEGQLVEANQPILRIASAKHSTQALELNQALLNQYSFQLQNLERLIAQQEQQNQLDLTELQQQKAAVQKRLIELNNQSETFTKRLTLNEQMVTQISTLKGTGYISELELQRQKDTLLSLQQQSSSMRSEKLSLQSQIAQYDTQLEKLPLQHAERINQLNSQRADMEIQLSSVEQQRLGELRAPKAGVVTGLLAKVGKNVVTGERLLSVIPENSQMQAVIYVPTSAFGFIESGQETKLRYHAFPYEKFGIYGGEIKQISSSLILPEETIIPGMITEPAYRVIVSLSKQHIQAYGKSTPLRAGMMLDADIIIEERSLLRWLFDPVFSIKGQL
ncbi:HlyD family efflux transporter periplasmic adaptor subunit [Pseudoalteromonas luteoviolacea]|uniref:Toxin n=1 Tax=Pseudoalteromonas luteoviolacea S4054 TaxID=1129367 RepID=A0A0F6AGD3_9GAMM|nr:HlyD family efflux transporter periplasmic adaptor subunit [Pseudoalteromonas luteoviolacea]AOT10073.1 toxin [Pseudoalteromonas luteoviolacea]AOT14984.1 toxin [Pseudoalteromonas luteoviolacea]AOT19901.1 toxin [Pseudoalteromonas luteoviolacea]KKE84836.1 toxin [Pseudoalteromonas luteoviolacea S4054]KZN72453.1 toxin [Pseudoalteromonas luteoviolacea S4047-1]